MDPETQGSIALRYTTTKEGRVGERSGVIVEPRETSAVTSGKPSEAAGMFTEVNTCVGGRVVRSSAAPAEKGEKSPASDKGIRTIPETPEETRRGPATRNSVLEQNSRYDLNRKGGVRVERLPGETDRDYRSRAAKAGMAAKKAGISGLDKGSKSAGGSDARAQTSIASLVVGPTNATSSSKGSTNQAPLTERVQENAQEATGGKRPRDSPGTTDGVHAGKKAASDATGGFDPLAEKELLRTLLQEERERNRRLTAQLEKAANEQEDLRTQVDFLAKQVAELSGRAAPRTAEEGGAAAYVTRGELAAFVAEAVAKLDWGAILARTKAAPLRSAASYGVTARTRSAPKQGKQASYAGAVAGGAPSQQPSATRGISPVSAEIERLEEALALDRARAEHLLAVTETSRESIEEDTLLPPGKGALLPSSEDGWTRVLTRTERNALRARPEPAKSTPPTPRAAPRRRQDVVAIKIGEQRSYADTLRLVREKANFGEVAVTGHRKTRAGDLIIEVDRANGGLLKAQQALTTALGETQEVRLLEAMSDVEIRDLDELAVDEEIRQAVAKLLPEGVRTLVKSIRPGFGGTRIAHVLVPAAHEEALRRAGRVRVGFVQCRLRVVPRIIRCFRCQRFGHFSSSCDNNKEGWEICRKCGQEGHNGRACKATYRCLLCHEAGLPETRLGHLAGSARCPQYINLAAKLRPPLQR